MHDQLTRERVRAAKSRGVLLLGPSHGLNSIHCAGVRPWYSGSALDYWSTGRAIDPAPGHDS